MFIVVTVILLQNFNFASIEREKKENKKTPWTVKWSDKKKWFMFTLPQLLALQWSRKIYNSTNLIIACYESMHHLYLKLKLTEYAERKRHGKVMRETVTKRALFNKKKQLENIHIGTGVSEKKKL